MTKDKRRPTVKLVADAVIDERVVSGKKWVRFEARGLVFYLKYLNAINTSLMGVYRVRVQASTTPTMSDKQPAGLPTDWYPWNVCAEDLRARASLVDPE